MQYVATYKSGKNNTSYLQRSDDVKSYFSILKFEIVFQILTSLTFLQFYCNNIQQIASLKKTENSKDL